MRKPSVPRILLHRAFPMEEVKVENITLNPMHEIRLYLNGDIEQYLFGQLVQEDNIGKEITDKDLEIWFAKKKKK